MGNREKNEKKYCIVKGNRVRNLISYLPPLFSSVLGCTLKSTFSILSDGNTGRVSFSTQWPPFGKGVPHMAGRTGDVLLHRLDTSAPPGFEISS